MSAERVTGFLVGLLALTGVGCRSINSTASSVHVEYREDLDLSSLGWKVERMRTVISEVVGGDHGVVRQALNRKWEEPNTPPLKVYIDTKDVHGQTVGHWDVHPGFTYNLVEFIQEEANTSGVIYWVACEEIVEVDFDRVITLFMHDIYYTSTIVWRYEGMRYKTAVGFHCRPVYRKAFHLPDDKMRDLLGAILRDSLRWHLSMLVDKIEEGDISKSVPLETPVKD